MPSTRRIFRSLRSLQMRLLRLALAATKGLVPMLSREEFYCRCNKINTILDEAKNDLLAVEKLGP